MFALHLFKPLLMESLGSKCVLVCRILEAWQYLALAAAVCAKSNREAGMPGAMLLLACIFDPSCTRSFSGFLQPS